ncbi:MAG: tetratricopeptide repeat protein, partial [Acidobacteriia bacterium]|nr:tetratricopeptide repeat protein [Terriglobia bacterium]
GGLRERVLTLVGARHGVPLPKIESLAVLPLENLSRDPEQEYFADGMTEELIANLGKVGALRVISRQSVMRYKRSEKPLPEIARELNVDAVVEGAVARSGGRVRITAQLIQANPEKNLWAETYERDLRDVLALQGEVARAIVQEIRVKLTPQEQVHLATTRPLNPEAHEAYLMGRYFWNKRTEEGFSKSIECFQRAIQKEPDYALAYAGLADSYVVLGSFGFRSPQEVMPKGKAAALKALAIDETLAEAHASLAMLKIDYEYDWLEAEREFQRAIELNPGYASAHQWYSQYLMARGRTAESLAENQRALDLDPLSPIMNSIYGWHLYFAGHDDEAIAQLRKTLEVNPDFPPAYFYLGLPYEHKGIYKEAIAKFEKALQLSGGGPIYVSALGHALGVAGRRTAAQRYLVVLEDLSRRSYVSPYDFAVVHAGLDHKDLVIAWLGKAYEDHSFRLIYLKVDPMFDPLRSDPRFQDLLRRMNFPP